MLEIREIKHFMEEDAASEKKKMARQGLKYYEGEHKIMGARLFYFDADGELKEDTLRSNIRISHPFFVAAHLFWLQINLIDCHRINRYNDISIEKEKVPEHLFFCRDKCSGTIYKHGYYIKIRNRIQ